MRTDCDRQLRLLTATKPERVNEDMPGEQPPRPGLEHLAQLGIEWQHDKVTDLGAEFGDSTLIADPHLSAQTGRTTYGKLDMAASLAAAPVAAPVTWVIEGEFPIGPTFRATFKLALLDAVSSGLTYANLRPDVVQVAPTGSFEKRVEPDGSVVPVPGDDARRQLRVIDIKLTSEPSAAYFAEVVLYSIALAGWLRDVGLEDQFLVAADAALWPGSHEASALRVMAQELRQAGGTPTPAELLPALDDELEVAPFEVFEPRVRKFFERELAQVLSEPWRDLDWHVDNRCKGCPFLGAPWQNADGPTWDPERRHCMQMAEDIGHLSRVAYVSRGARSALNRAGVNDVPGLSGRTASDAAFDDHYVLRSTRTVVAERAVVLDENRSSHVAPDSGTSAVMPRWADLRISISVDFDVSSAISFAFGLKGFVSEPFAYGVPKPAGGGKSHSWEEVFPVDQRDIKAEGREFLAFLSYIDTMLTTTKRDFPTATVQFYVWDDLQQKHFARVVGRHLEAILNNPATQHLAWLFPSEELLANPALERRKSPITVVRQVVRGVLAAPIAHYYSLLELARVYHRSTLPAGVATFSVHPMFEDPLSDQIPSERAHDIWSRSTDQRRNWTAQLKRLDETVKKRLGALEAVRQRLEYDLRPALRQTAPKIGFGAMKKLGAVSVDSELWYAHARLDAALDAAEADQTRSMPMHEREARFKSARLDYRIVGDAADEALTRLGLTPRQGLRVYQLGESSREVKVRAGDLGFAISPQGSPGLLDRSLRFVVEGAGLPTLEAKYQNVLLSDVFSVVVEAVDRASGEIVLSMADYWPKRLARPTLIDDLEASGIDLSTDVALDPVGKDFFTRKLAATLKAIGNPPGAAKNPLVQRALGHAGKGPRRTAHVPAADFLWNAAATHHETVDRNLPAARAVLDAAGVTLNASQWSAWERALSRRLQTIWGPPGTGKSRTLRAVALGAIADAEANGAGLRILICASTYTAMDNVLQGVLADASAVAPGADVEVHRLRSEFSECPDWLPDGNDRLVERRDPSQVVVELRERLDGATGVTVVASTPQQLHNLMTVGDDAPTAKWFDLIILDEASQTDVAQATLALASAAEGAALVPAGDPKQLPPIHQAEPPLGLEALVGSFMSFMEDAHGLTPMPLTVNYRSNESIVEFARQGGYPRELASFSPELELQLRPADGAAPPHWTASAGWTPEWDAMLDSKNPTVAFVYDDKTWSSQWNHFEASAAAALAVALRARFVAGLRGEQEPASGHNDSPPDDHFWTECIGIVTPHRAQQALIVAELQRAFPNVAEDLLRGAVDTVERFQGQERDAIIVSYALGDVDAIRDEEEFLLGFNRFNVAVSRARAKVIVLASEQVIEHLSDEVQVLRGSKLLKLYTNGFTNQHRAMTLSYSERNGTVRAVAGQFRWRDGA